MITKEDLAQAVLDLKNSQQKTDAKLDRMASIRGGGFHSENPADIEKIMNDFLAELEPTDDKKTEEFYFNSLKKNPVLNGIRFDFIDKNISRNCQGIEDEYDLLLVNGKDVFIIEVKYKAHPQDLQRLLGKKHSNFKKLFPLYKDYTHHLGLATFHINDELKDLAHEQGVTVLQRSGNVIETFAA